MAAPGDNPWASVGHQPSLDHILAHAQASGHLTSEVCCSLMVVGATPTVTLLGTRLQCRREPRHTHTSPTETVWCMVRCLSSSHARQRPLSRPPALLHRDTNPHPCCLTGQQQQERRACWSEDGVAGVERTESVALLRCLGELSARLATQDKVGQPEHGASPALLQTLTRPCSLHQKLALQVHNASVQESTEDVTSAAELGLFRF